MEFTHVVRTRRMVRTYDPSRPVPREVLDGLLELAIRAPSAGFSQGWDFLVLDTPEDVGRFWSVSSDPDADSPWLRGMRSAPVLILCLSDPEHYLDRYAEPDKGWTDRDPARWAAPYWDVDTGMAALLLLLGATDLGLGSCFFGVAPGRHAATREAFGVPGNRNLVGVVSLGHPAPDRRSPSLRRGRRPASAVTHYGRFTPPPPRSP